jgi:hypothetical protein
MASAAGQPLRQSHTTERDNECDDARAVGLLLLTVMIPMAAGPAAAYIGHELAGDAKITIDQARAMR